MHAGWRWRAQDRWCLYRSWPSELIRKSESWCETWWVKVRYQAALPKSLGSLSTSRIESKNYEGDGHTTSQNTTPRAPHFNTPVLHMFKKVVTPGGYHCRRSINASWSRVKWLALRNLHINAIGPMRTGHMTTREMNAINTAHTYMRRM